MSIQSSVNAIIGSVGSAVKGISNEYEAKMKEATKHLEMRQNAIKQQKSNVINQREMIKTSIGYLPQNLLEKAKEVK